MTEKNESNNISFINVGLDEYLFERSLARLDSADVVQGPLGCGISAHMQVCARLRPCSVGEASDISVAQIEEKAQADVVFGPDVTQEVVIERVLESQLERFLLEPGFNAIVLAYGQTGSGKTHTIFGPPGVLTEHDYKESGGRPLSWGFFPYAAISMLNGLDEKGLSKRAQLKVTAVEIYLETWSVLLL